MINICDMARGMKNIENFYGSEPIEIEEIHFKGYEHTAFIVLKNGEEWEIEYAGQVRLIK